MPDAAKPVLVEYNIQRPFLRLLFGLLEVMVFVGFQHGYTARWPVQIGNCSGGWTEALEFLGYFLALATLIEIIHWIAWRVLHRKEVLSFEEQQQLFGKSAPSRVRSLGSKWGGVQGLFESPGGITAGTSTAVSTEPKDYVLVESGGKLPLVPRNPLLAFVFIILVLIVVLVVTGPNSLDSCVSPSFSWRDLLSRLIFAYAFLAVGSMAEFRIVEAKDRSSAARSR